MNKNSYYGNRLNGLNPYNYLHSSYSGYIHPYKKNYFKGRPKPNNIQINSNSNYFENRNKNYYYNNTFNNLANFSPNQNFHYSSVFQKNRNYKRYIPYFTEEKKIAEEIKNDSVNEEEKNEEVLKIRVNISDTQCTELVLCKNDDISEKVLEFCKNNNISKNLLEPLVNKINQSLNTLEIIKSNMTLDKKEFLILDKVKNISDVNDTNEVN